MNTFIQQQRKKKTTRRNTKTNENSTDSRTTYTKP
jgi:hypothetical protein